jgi:hypothetical protein
MSRRRSVRDKELEADDTFAILQSIRDRSERAASQNEASPDSAEHPTSPQRKQQRGAMASVFGNAKMPDPSRAGSSGRSSPAPRSPSKSAMKSPQQRPASPSLLSPILKDRRYSDNGHRDSSNSAGDAEEGGVRLPKDAVNDDDDDSDIDADERGRGRTRSPDAEGPGAGSESRSPSLSMPRKGKGEPTKKLQSLHTRC